MTRRPHIEFVVQPKAALPSTDYDQIVAFVRDGIDCLEGFVSSQGDEIMAAVSVRQEDALYAYVYTDLELTDNDKKQILEQIDWDRIEETTDTGRESHDRIELGSWHDLKACWGYSKDHDAEGLMLCDQDGDDIDFYSEGDLDGVLCRVGSMGCYHLIFSVAAWETVPALTGDFCRLYQRWGC